MKKIAIILSLFLFSLGQFCFASNVEGTHTYQDYLFILVHGINGGSYNFNGSDSRASDLNLLGFMKKPVSQGGMGLDGYVYAYSFKNNKEGSMTSVRELADPSYNNTATYKDENGDIQSMNGKCWLEKAKEDFKKWYAKNHEPWRDERNWKEVPDSLVPSKYILVTHSMGNMPARLYIYSKDLLGENWGGSLKNLYRYDVDKVVFIAPPFTGSDLAWLGLVPKSFVSAYLAKMKVEQYSRWYKKIMTSNFLIDCHHQLETIPKPSTINPQTINLSSTN